MEKRLNPVPFVRRRPFLTGCLVIALLPVGLVTWYLVMLFRALVGEPTITSTYYDALVAPSVAVQPKDRAVRPYAEAAALLTEYHATVNAAYQAHIASLEASGVTPADADYNRQPEAAAAIATPDDAGLWQIAVDYVRDAGPILDLVKRASAMPGVGFVQGGEIDDDVAKWLALDPSRSPGSGGAEPPRLTGYLPPLLRHYRSFARLLHAEMRVARYAGDGATAAANSAAMLRVARHVREQSLLINDLVTMAIERLAIEEIFAILAKNASIFSESDLRTIDDALANSLGAKWPTSALAGERLYFYDMVQRAFTDDGNGDGHITLDGLRSLGLPPTSIFVAPFASSRAEVVDHYEAFAGRVDALMHAPSVAERSALFPEDPVPAGEAGGLLDPAVTMLSLFATEPTKMDQAYREAGLRARAARVIVAIERFTRATGKPPPRLESLVPNFLPTIEPEPISGMPVAYRPAGGPDDGPAVYSVGIDQQDDGGLHDRRALRDAPRAGVDFVLFPPHDDDEDEDSGLP